MFIPKYFEINNIIFKNQNIELVLISKNKFKNIQISACIVQTLPKLTNFGNNLQV